MVRPPRSRRIFSSRGNRANCRASAATKECRRFTNGSAEKKHNAILVRHPVLRIIQWYCYRSPLVLPDRSRVTSRGCLITPGCARTRRRPNASRRDVSLVSRLNVYASLVVRQKRTRAPQLPRLHLRRRGLRGLVVEPGPLRVEPAGAHLRAPHVELGVLVLVQAGGVRERPRRRIRLSGERRRLDAVAVACVSFWFFARMRFGWRVQ